MYDDRKETMKFVLFIVGVVFAVLLVIFGLVFLAKSFKVWSAGQDGKAKLAEATFSKQVQLEEAKANLESEKLNALAEVERAKGAAEAIQIEGGSLSENYIRYLWVRQQSNLNDKTVIYIPTEAGLPILEAGRR